MNISLLRYKNKSTRLKIKREECKIQKRKLGQYKTLDTAEGILSGLEAHVKSISSLIIASRLGILVSKKYLIAFGWAFKGPLYHIPSYHLADPKT